MKTAKRPTAPVNRYGYHEHVIRNAAGKYVTLAHAPRQAEREVRAKIDPRVALLLETVAKAIGFDDKPKGERLYALVWYPKGDRSPRVAELGAHHDVGGWAWMSCDYGGAAVIGAFDKFLAECAGRGVTGALMRKDVIERVRHFVAEEPAIGQ